MFKAVREKIKLWRFLLPARGGRVGLIPAEKIRRALGHGQQARRLAGDLDHVTQILQVRAQPLRDLSRGVELQRETALALAALNFVFLVLAALLAFVLRTVLRAGRERPEPHRREPRFASAFETFTWSKYGLDSRRGQSSVLPIPTQSVENPSPTL